MARPAQRRSPAPTIGHAPRTGTRASLFRVTIYSPSLQTDTVAFDTDASVGESASRELLAELSGAESLADLQALLGVNSASEAYFEAKRLWAARSLDPQPAGDGFPGQRVAVDGTDFFVHGITHANTEAEAAVLREHVTERLAEGAAVYCEEGIREMYLADVAGVSAMDDYRWAMERCAEADLVPSIRDLPSSELAGLREDVSAIAGRYRDLAFALIESGSDLYGAEFASALGDVASALLTSREDLATGEDFEAFRRTRRAAEDPAHLPDLQAYYRRKFLPQPIEREWLRRHDRQLELVTHARNERMADYLLHHADADLVEVIVGAAHQPGVVYYLERYRDGERRPGQFEYVD